MSQVAMKLVRCCKLLVLLALVTVFGSSLPRPVHAFGDGLRDVDRALSRWDIAGANSALAGLAQNVDRDVKRGVVAVYEARYADAEEILAGALASGELTSGGATEEEARHYLALARGSARALGSATTLLSPDGTVEAVFADPKDMILAPYLFEAMAEAREALAGELGVRPSDPVRFEFYDDPLKLAMVTPLTVENIRTTGTVGVTKYRRIMMISPRVMLYGYGWLDTAVHEYVHYLLTIRTRNKAPVWLQEGLAKLLETRWRRADPEPLDSAVAHRLHRAIVGDTLVTLDEMYPSVAMLPSAEKAALAYAEVETMLQLVRERRGAAGIEVLLDRVAAGDDAREALATAWGADFDDFMAEWKKVTRVRTAKAEGGEIDRPVFKSDEDDQPAERLEDVFSHLGGGRARQHARLGSLLHARGHKEAAAMQYEKARKSDARARRDATLARRLGMLLVDLGKFAEAVPLLDLAALESPDDANLAAAQGRALLRSGDGTAAGAALGRAIRVNPFIPTLHCDLAALADDDLVRDRESALCRE
jgi:tetratricopeptide (TPR) repeat protein